MFPDLMMGVFLLFLSITENRAKGTKLFPVLYKTLRFNYLPKAPSPNSIRLAFPSPAPKLP